MIFDLKQTTDHFGISIRGVIQVGAFVGEELPAYRSLGLFNTILFEPQPKIFEIAKEKCCETERVYNVALGSQKGEMDMYLSHTEGGITNGSGASSSLLRPKKHLTEHPQVKFIDRIKVEVDTLDSFLNEHKINTSEYNFLNIDVQGFELEVLKGGYNTLNNIDAMILEINRDEVYEGCPMVEEIDLFLAEAGFNRVLTCWQSESWGDGFYIKVDK